jgi:hypothetical protein
MKNQHGKMKMENRWEKIQYRLERQQSSCIRAGPPDPAIFTITMKIPSNCMNHPTTIRATRDACFESRSLSTQETEGQKRRN